MYLLREQVARVVISGACVLVALLSPGWTSVAQDQAQEQGKPAGSAALAYEAKVAEWRGVLKKLADLRTEYQAAKGVEVEQIRKKWALTIQEADGVLNSLRDAALAAFVESPNQDRKLTRFLVRMLKDALDQDRYEIVQKAAVTLIENKCDDRTIYDMAGHASFALNDFQSAAKYLREADLKNSISPMGRNFLMDVDTYIKYWDDEQAIRKQEAEADNLPRVKLTTNKGEILVELFENEAPDTVGNFVSLVEVGFYDNKKFHRVLKNFVAQTGCPKGDGTGDAGYSIYCECSTPKYRKHFRGSLSMAHAGPDTGGSQFFLTFRATPNLNGKHTVFGRVIKGLEILEKLQRVDPDAENAPNVAVDKIIKAELVRKRDHEYSPRKVK